MKNITVQAIRTWKKIRATEKKLEALSVSLNKLVLEIPDEDVASYIVATIEPEEEEERELESGEYLDPRLNKKLNEDDPRLTNR